MILYRKEKDYKQELSIINPGIEAFEKFYKTQSGKPSKKISEISEKDRQLFFNSLRERIHEKRKLL